LFNTAARRTPKKEQCKKEKKANQEKERERREREFSPAASMRSVAMGKLWL
jgi:hypothetical protein